MAPFVVAAALPFIKWDNESSPDSNGVYGFIIRGDLPNWASWCSTPDERLPGGTYELAVRNILWKYGRHVCSFYWLSIRNVGYGLLFRFAVPLARPWGVDYGYFEQGPYWWLRKKLGPFQLKAGYRCYFIQGKFYGVPCLTITK